MYLIIQTLKWNEFMCIIVEAGYQAGVCCIIRSMFDVCGHFKMLIIQSFK